MMEKAGASFERGCRTAAAIRCRHGAENAESQEFCDGYYNSAAADGIFRIGFCMRGNRQKCVVRCCCIVFLLTEAFHFLRMEVAVVRQYFGGYSLQLKYVGVVFALVVLMLGLVGCAQMAPSLASEEVVKLRAQARWGAVVAGDWGKAYTFSTPAYRDSVDLYGFRRSHDGFVKYKEAEVLSVKCEEAESCKVRIRIRFSTAFSHEGFGESSTDIEDVWVRDAGEWWRYSAI